MSNEPASKATVASQEKLKGGPSFVNDLDPFFDGYSKMAQVEDERTTEDWNAVSQNHLIVVSPNIVVHRMQTRLLQSGLFAAVVATFLAPSFQNLKPDPQEKSAFYLEKTYQLFAESHRTHDVPFFPSQSNPPASSPPKSAVWVNSLWSLSLVIILSSALLAVLVQQWARRYIKLTQLQSASSPRGQARIRAFFDKGAEDLHLRWTVAALPALLHASLVLFLAGFIIFSLGYNHTVLKVVVSWVGPCAVVYVCFTLLPLLRFDSPYYTPLSPTLWFIYNGTLYVAFQILRWCTAFNFFSEETWNRFGHSESHYRRRFLHRIEEAAEESVQKSPLEVDNRILLWALRSSDESIPDFRDSKVLDEFRAFKMSNAEKMVDTLIGLMNRTLSSDLITQSTKDSWIKNYTEAMVGLSLPINRQTLEHVLYEDWGALLDSVEFGLLLRKAHYKNPFAEYYSQCVVSAIIAKVKVRDDRWFELVTGQLGISRSTLESYLEHGDSVLLANCIFLCRRTLDVYSEHEWNCDVYSRSKTLDLVSRFDIQDALPGLQHEFCDMWNKLVRNAGDRRSRNPSIYILKHIRNVYSKLHRSIAAPAAFTAETSDDDIILLFPSSYPPCKITRHHPTCSAMVYNVGVKRSEEPLPDDASPVLPIPVHARATPSNNGRWRFPPGLLSNPFSVIRDAIRTYATVLCPSVTPHSTYTAPSPSQDLLSRIRHHRKKAASNTPDATPGAAARAVLDDVLAVSQPSAISIAPPPSAVLRKDGPRLNGPLPDNIHGTTLTSTSSTAGSIPVLASLHDIVLISVLLLPTRYMTLYQRPSQPRAAHTPNRPQSPLSRSDHIPPGPRPLAANNSTVLLQQQQSVLSPRYNSRFLATSP
ncbi:hypothetical protein EDB83DRAFT_2564867 [Lactarius deliciosus]|nr:hypothetical protein EDB83DRAFT_2564867 [Lactarius deliciosus]